MKFAKVYEIELIAFTSLKLEGEQYLFPKDLPANLHPQHCVDQNIINNISNQIGLSKMSMECV